MNIRRRVAFEHNRRLLFDMCLVGTFSHFREIFFTPFIRQPGNLEWAVSFDESTSVVVNRLAWPREQSRCGVAVAENQLRVSLTRLQRDSHSHLANGCSRES